MIRFEVIPKSMAAAETAIKERNTGFAGLVVHWCWLESQRRMQRIFSERHRPVEQVPSLN
jgi:hypothetical protein